MGKEGQYVGIGMSVLHLYSPLSFSNSFNRTTIVTVECFTGMLVSLGYIDVILYEASETEKGKYISEHNISYFHNNSDNHLAKIKVPANCVCTL